MVPATHFQSDPQVYSLMIEVRRDLILDSTLEHKSGRFDQVRANVLAAVSTAEAATAANLAEKKQPGFSTISIPI